MQSLKRSHCLIINILSLIMALCSCTSWWSHALEYSCLSRVISALVRHRLCFLGCHCKHCLWWFRRSCILVSLNGSIPWLWLIYAESLLARKLQLLNSVVIVFVYLNCAGLQSKLVLLIKRSFLLVYRSRHWWYLILCSWSWLVIYVAVSLVILEIV